MQRKFLSNLGFLILVNLIIKPLYIFGIDLVIQNEVGEAVYGNYYALLKFALILSTVLDLGIENFNRKEIAGNDAILDKFLSNFFVLKIILGFIYLTLGITGGIISEFEWQEMKFMVLILLNEFLRSMILYMRANLGGLHKFKTDSIFSVFDRIILIIVCAILLLNKQWFGNFKIEWFILSQTLAYSLSFILVFKKVLKYVTHFKPSLKWNYSLAILKQLSPYALLMFLMAIYNHIDPFLLKQLLSDGEKQSGIYAQSGRILEICANYSYLFAVILLPIFSRMIRQKENIDKILRLSYFLIIIPSVLAVIGFNIFKTEIISSLYPSGHEVISARIFGTLMFSLLGISSTYIYGTLLTANGNLKQLNVIAFFGVLISISLNLILIPDFKALGSAIANISSQIITALVQIILAIKIFKIKPKYKRSFIILLYFGLLITIGKILYIYLNLNWLIEFVIFLFAGISMVLIVVKKDIKQFIELIRTKN